MFWEPLHVSLCQHMRPSNHSGERGRLWSLEEGMQWGAEDKESAYMPTNAHGRQVEGSCYLFKKARFLSEAQSPY